jgi:hypothetical protein
MFDSLYPAPVLPLDAEMAVVRRALVVVVTVVAAVEEEPGATAVAVVGWGCVPFVVGCAGALRFFDKVTGAGTVADEMTAAADG